MKALFFWIPAACWIIVAGGCVAFIIRALRKRLHPARVGHGIATAGMIAVAAVTVAARAVWWRAFRRTPAFHGPADPDLCMIKELWAMPSAETPAREQLP